MQPKISSIPDSIGAFISERYPALLADPETQPEIYNSAVTDYGVYASPELYGSDNINDYVLYADADDYVLAPQKDESKPEVIAVSPVEEKTESTETEDYLSVPEYVKPVVEKSQQKATTEQMQAEDVKTDAEFVVVVRGDTLYSIAQKNQTTVEKLAKINSLNSPYTLSIGQKIRIRAPQIKPVVDKKMVEQKTIQNETPKQIQPAKVVKQSDVKRVALREVTVQKGDTLYSLSREYQIPVNDLAIMNKLSSPFTLSIGQKIKVPNINKVENQSIKEVAPVKSEVKKQTIENKKISPKAEPVKPVVQKNAVVQAKTPTPKVNAKSEAKTKISSNPKKQLPKISARSSNKFSWPVRGKILSQYGAKTGGLFNDGINISATLGTVVRVAENGVVAYAGNEVKGMGNLIIVQHSDGWMTVYAHLDSMSVRRGTRVNVGDVIGKIGKTGKVDKPQLHFEIRKGTKAYNPITYLKK